MSAERVAAALEATLEQTQVSEWDKKIQGDPKANNPIFVVRGLMLSAGGRFETGGLGVGSLGEGCPALLWETLDDSQELYTN